MRTSLTIPEGEPFWKRLIHPLLLAAAVFAGFLLVGCAPAEEPAGTGAPAGAEEPGPAEAPAPEPASPLEDPGRPETDLAQDAGRKPLEVYEFVGIEEGMAVGDLWAAGGYNTHLLSLLVGDTGTVYALMDFYSDREAFGGNLYSVDEIEGRIQEAQLENVVVALNWEDIPDDSLDAAVSIRNYHDLGTSFPERSREEAAAQMYRVLTPGGALGIVEVSTEMEAGWDESRHTLAEQTVIDELTAAGFELEATTDILRNADDTVTEDTFSAGRHTLDRYLLRFRKPSQQ